jgi:hypothetical protein
MKVLVLLLAAISVVGFQNCSESEDSPVANNIELVGSASGSNTPIFSQLTEIQLNGRRFKFQIDSIEVGADGPVLVGWMCRVGQSSNTSSSVSINGGGQSSENLTIRNDLRSTCNSNAPKAGFSIPFNAGVNEELVFKVTHTNFDGPVSLNTTQTHSVNLGVTLESYLGNAINGLLNTAAAVAPTMTIPEVVRQADRLTIAVNSRELFSDDPNTTSSPLRVPEATMCAERDGTNACRNLANWPRPKYELRSYEHNGQIPVSSPNNDVTYFEEDGFGPFKNTKSIKSFRPVEYGFQVNTKYNVYHRDSFGNETSASFTVVP